MRVHCLGLSKHDKGPVRVSLKLRKFIYQPRSYRLFFEDEVRHLVCTYCHCGVLEPSPRPMNMDVRISLSDNILN